MSNRESGTASRNRWWKWLVLPASVTVVIVSLGGWRMWQVGRYQQALADANAQMAAGRNGLAARTLAAILDWKPDADEAMYLLGLCEKTRSRPREAAEAWLRIPPESPFWAPAMYYCRELKVERGLLADAEQLLKFAQKNAPDHGFILNALFVPIYCYQGRLGEASQMVEAEWDHFNQIGEGASEKAIHLIALHIGVRGTIADLEPARDYLDKASRVASEDDRVWLGRADLAIRKGAFDEAAQFLDKCLRRRPDDIPVWRARLSYALATDQLAIVQQALERLPAEESNPAQVHKLVAWIARHEGDLKTEERELNRLLEVDPSDRSALTRLVELAEKAGDPKRSAELGRRNKEIGQIEVRYQKLYKRNQPIRDAEEMARLAAKLGRGFEAKAFLTIAVAENPGRTDLRDELARISRETTAGSLRGRTLAQAVDEELAHTRRAE